MRWRAKLLRISVYFMCALLYIVDDIYYLVEIRSLFVFRFIIIVCRKFVGIIIISVSKCRLRFGYEAGGLLRFCMSHLWFLESFLRKQLISRLISMSQKVKRQSRHRCQKKGPCRLLTTNDKGSVSSVSCEKPEATVALLLLS